jgi:hypothetical protein
MKLFLLVFEDVLGAHRHDPPEFSRTRVVESPSKESLIGTLDLVRCKNPERELYWNGENGEVLISIEEIPGAESRISSKKELSDFVWHLSRHWY